MSGWWFASLRRAPGRSRWNDAATAMRPVLPPNANRHRQQIRAEQIRLLFEQLPAALIATTIVGALVVYVLWGHVSPLWLLLWLLALAVTTAVRVWLMRAYFSEPRISACNTPLLPSRTTLNVASPRSGIVQPSGRPSASA